MKPEEAVADGINGLVPPTQRRNTTERIARDCPASSAINAQGKSLYVIVVIIIATRDSPSDSVFWSRLIPHHLC